MPLTCLAIVLAEFTDLARDVTASIMSSFVFPWAISESRNPCSSDDESVNPFASSSTDSLTDSPNVLLVPSFEWGAMSREKRRFPQKAQVAESRQKGHRASYSVSTQVTRACLILS